MFQYDIVRQYLPFKQQITSRLRLDINLSIIKNSVSGTEGVPVFQAKYPMLRIFFKEIDGCSPFIAFYTVKNQKGASMGPEISRPTSVTVISWVWIVIGCLMILGGAMGFFSYTMMQEMSGGQAFPSELPPDVPGSFKPMMVIFSNFQIIAALQVFIAIIAIVSGIQFLKLRSWARTTLEGLTWLSLTYIIVFGLYWIYMWVSMTGSIPQEHMQPGMEYFKYFGVIMGTIVNLIFGAPLVIMLIKLRGSVIRNVVK